MPGRVFSAKNGSHRSPRHIAYDRVNIEITRAGFWSFSSINVESFAISRWRETLELARSAEGDSQQVFAPEFGFLKEVLE